MNLHALKHSHSFLLLMTVYLLVWVVIIVNLQVVFLYTTTSSVSLCISTIFTLIIYRLDVGLILTSYYLLSTSAHLLNKIVNMSRIICLLPKYVGSSCYHCYQNLLLLTFAHLYSFLNYIVSISILHHLVQRATHGLSSFFTAPFDNFLYNFLLIFFCSISQAFLNYITSKLMIT